MGEVAYLVLTNHDLIRRIVSFHCNDIIEFFRKGRPDLFWIRRFNKDEIAQYIQNRIDRAMSYFVPPYIPQVEIDFNISPSKKCNHYSINYKVSGTGHGGYCSGAKSDEIEPFDFHALIVGMGT